MKQTKRNKNDKNYFVREIILSFIKKNPEMHSNEVAKKLKYSRQTIAAYKAHKTMGKY